jgi:nickel-dependent lactate racemase
MRIELSYGFDGLEVELPESSGFQGVWRPQEAAAEKDPAAAVATALREPLDSLPLAELARNKKTACIVISDITRPVPNPIILPPLLQTLAAAGIEMEQITILIATGIHRPNEGDELIRLVGAEVAATGCRIINHFSKDRTEMAEVTKIDGHIPALVNRHYLAAELKILTGFIEPHMWAGYSGGRKSILPGISGIETLEYMHGPEMIAHPRTVYGALDDNPFHLAGLEVMAAAGADFTVNVTLNTDKEITRVFAGDPVKAHLAGCRFLAPYCVKQVEQPLDFIVTTNSGAPLDCNLYQTVKGITGAAPVVRKKGEIIIASACFEGLGSPEYIEILKLVDSPENFIRRVMQREFFIPDQWCAQETYQVMIDHPVWLKADGVAPQDLERYHFRPVKDIGQAISELLAKLGPDAHWAAVPDGPLLILEPTWGQLDEDAS